MEAAKVRCGFCKKELIEQWAVLKKLQQRYVALFLL